MSIEDRDYWHEDRHRRSAARPKPGMNSPQPQQEITRLARAAIVRMRLDPRPSKWRAFLFGAAVGTFATLFLVGLLRL